MLFWLQKLICCGLLLGAMPAWGMVAVMPSLTHGSWLSSNSQNSDWLTWGALGVSGLGLTLWLKNRSLVNTIESIQQTTGQQVKGLNACLEQAKSESLRKTQALEQQQQVVTQQQKQLQKKDEELQQKDELLKSMKEGQGRTDDYIKKLELAKAGLSEKLKKQKKASREKKEEAGRQFQQERDQHKIVIQEKEQEIQGLSKQLTEARQNPVEKQELLNDSGEQGLDGSAHQRKVFASQIMARTNEMDKKLRALGEFLLEEDKRRASTSQQKQPSGGSV